MQQEFDLTRRLQSVVYICLTSIYRKAEWRRAENFAAQQYFSRFDSGLIDAHRMITSIKKCI